MARPAQGCDGRELQRQRAKLDQLDRLHSRRVEQIEKLYASIEAAVEALLDEVPDPDQHARGFDELTGVRQKHGGARIYLPDIVDRFCLDFIEEAKRAWEAKWLAVEFGAVDLRHVPQDAQRAMDGSEASKKSAAELRDRIRVALRSLLRGDD